MMDAKRKWIEAPRRGFDDNPRSANFQDARVRSTLRTRLVAASIAALIALIAISALWN